MLNIKRLEIDVTRAEIIHLKPCPNCKSLDLILSNLNDRNHVLCQKCKMRGPGGLPQECTEFWNVLPRRSDD